MTDQIRVDLDPESPGVRLLLELTEIAERRGSLPEFRQRLLEIAECLRGGLEAVRVDGDHGAADAGHILLSLDIRQPLFDRASALRALDRDFDAAA